MTQQILADISKILQDNVLYLEDILIEIRHVPVSYGQWYIQNVANLEIFLKNYNFFVENGRAAVSDPDLVDGSREAVAYFENELKFYDEAPNYMNFRGHLGQAEDIIIDYINSFYPNVEFKHFLKAHPDVFIVNDDDTVWSMEMASVEYFKDCLKDIEEALHFLDLRSHMDGASDYIVNYINTNYPGNSFIDFLRAHPYVFTVLDHDTVDLTEILCVEYFEESVGNREGLHVMSLRRQLRKAPCYVANYINAYYPGKSFLNFIYAHPESFVVLVGNTVFLTESECVKHFEKCLENKEGVHYMNLRGHLGQAPRYVIDYINTHYPGKDFLEFLEINLHVFSVDDNGNVFLKEKKK